MPSRGDISCPNGSEWGGCFFTTREMPVRSTSSSLPPPSDDAVVPTTALSTFLWWIRQSNPEDFSARFYFAKVELFLPILYKKEWLIMQPLSEIYQHALTTKSRNKPSDLVAWMTDYLGILTLFVPRSPPLFMPLCFVSSSSSDLSFFFAQLCPPSAFVVNYTTATTTTTTATTWNRQK